jgi:hypothetical protein
MTRTHAARRLLEHGPLTATEFREITGWKGRTSEVVLRQLCQSRIAKRVADARGFRYVYRLAS